MRPPSVCELITPNAHTISDATKNDHIIPTSLPRQFAPEEQRTCQTLDARVDGHWAKYQGF